MNDEWNGKQIGQEVETWLKEIKSKGGFGVHPEILEAVNRDFEGGSTSNEQNARDYRALLFDGQHESQWRLCFRSTLYC
jgi:hypothetical protein